MKTPANPPSRPEVFGIPIQGGSLEEILAWALDETSTDQKWILTANPEILLEAKQNPAYAVAVKQADYVCVDGFGLWIGLRCAGYPVERVTGVKLAEALMAEAAQKKLRVGFIGGAPGVAARARTFWEGRFPELNTVAEEGGKIQPDGAGDLAEEEAVHRLVLEAPQMLLVAFGGGSKQEAWIARRLADLPSVKLVVGVGGTFDFWVGRIKRAPKVLQTLGLEWAWRLIQEPQRWKRILRATIVFPLLFLVDQFKRPGPARKQLAYTVSILLRVLFFLFILCPALNRYIQAIFAQGIRTYRWMLVDLIVPIVVFVVLYPVYAFFRRFHRQKKAS